MPQRTDNSFSQTAKIALIKRDLSVTELAKRLERPRPTVSAIINGSTLYPKLRKKVARFLNCAA